MLGSIKGPYKIKCPLCRKVTNCRERGTGDLMDNFFVPDRIHSTRILTCKECRGISGITTCDRCQVLLCETCMFTHMKTKCGKEWQDGGLACIDTNREEEENADEDDVGLEERLMTEMIQTKYHFKLERRIVIPNDYDDSNLNLNLSSMACFNENQIIAAPNCDSLVLIYNDKGEELLRQFIPMRVIGLSSGIEGYPLLIQNNHYAVYKYCYGNIETMFSTPTISPRAISSFNNGRIVIVGTKLTHTKWGAKDTPDATFCIYEYNGAVVADLSTEQQDHHLEHPTSVCVNMTNNDFFVGDKMKKQVVRFKEDGSYVSSYQRSDLPDSFLGIPVPTALINNSVMFPLSLSYCQTNDQLYASFLTAVERGIYVLSPALDLLGLFNSADSVGIPAGISCDGRGRLYVGDGTDGIIRIFKLSVYLNRV
ncbi:hypothetical protein FSP39_015588 [Pinctada imbricata]|uniref:Uncharacterized protein n=1 Tax=Pinctada imbricata TaxID=66713 RepID=A0AA89BME0_PINIB|nr:hypothetical protein FSP39_015588 [Pinctada imbricata]